MDDDGSRALLTAVVEKTAGKAGSFSFSLAQENENYGTFRKLRSYVDVYRDEEENPIWSGRVIDDGAPFQPIQEITCEGIKAVLNDTQFRPVSYSGTLDGLVQTILESHNAQVAGTDPEKMIAMRTIEPEDSYLTRNYEVIEKTLDRLDDLVDSYGGYMEVVKENNVLYLDWYAGPVETGSQTIEFGQNMLDIRQDSSAADIYTRVIPLGAEIENDEGGRNRLDIRSVNGDLDYIDNAEGIAEFGIICAVETWDDVTTPAVLKARGTEWLADHARSRVSVQVTAVDLADTGEDVQNFRPLQQIRIRSEAHALDTDMIVLSQTIDLLHPDQNQMVLDEIRIGYVSRARKQARVSEKIVERIDGQYVTNQWLEEIRQQIQREYRSMIEQEADRISLQVQEVIHTAEGITTRVNGIQNDLSGIQLFVAENGSKLGYLYLDQATGILWIGRDGDPIRLAETNRAIKFVDSGDNMDLLVIDPDGITTKAANIETQITMRTEDYQEWAIRLGSEDGDGNHNFDIMYVGNN